MKKAVNPPLPANVSFSMCAEQTRILWANHRRNPKQAWEGTVIDVWSNGSESASYILKALKQEGATETAVFRQPVGSAYEANPLPPTSGKSGFVIKLPLLDGLEDRLDAVSAAYQQEYDLRDRFPPGHPEVLPRLIPAVWNEYGESRHPYLALSEEVSSKGLDCIPCVVREYVDGISLEKWIRAQARKTSSSSPSSSSSSFDFCGLEEPGTWFELASALLKTLGKLHRERATHGFLFPGNIILRPEAVEALEVRNSIPENSIVFINAAENHRNIYMEVERLTDDARLFPVRRWYDSPDNIYRLGESTPRWACFQLDQGSDYYSATDIFSLGVTLAYLATGDAKAASPFDYVQDWPGNLGWQIIRGAETRRRYQVMKAKLLDSLLSSAEQRNQQRYPSNRESNKSKYDNALRQAEVILQCIRSRSDRRAISPNHALTVLRLFRPDVQPGRSNRQVSDSELVGNESFSRMLIALANEITQNPDRSEEFVSNLLNLCTLRCSAGTADLEQVPGAIVKLVSERMRSVLERVSSLDCISEKKVLGSGTMLHAPYLRVAGSRTTLVDAFLTALSSLSENDEIIALTTPALWNDENFGPTSRVSSMLQLLRLKGVQVGWVFLVDNLFKPQTQRVLGFRCADDRKIAELRASSGGYYPAKGAAPETTAEPPPTDKITYDGFYYVCLESAAYEKVLREKKTFIGFRKRKAASDVENPLELHIAPDLGSRGGFLGALTFWMNPRRGRRLISAFDEHRKLAVPVFNFERTL